jgi:hypothetical protein
MYVLAQGERGLHGPTLLFTCPGEEKKLHKIDTRLAGIGGGGGTTGGSDRGPEEVAHLAV